MKKLCLVVTAVFAFVLAINSPLIAQTADASAKTDQELAKENATLRKQVDRLRLELRNAKLHEEVHALRAEKDRVAVAPTNTKGAIEATANQNAQAWTDSAVAISPTATNAYAADLPLKAPRGVAVGERGFYAWLDGSYQRINLPAYNLGLKNITLITAVDLGVKDPFDAHASGAGFAGGFGYLMPYAPTSPWFGSNLRVEVAGSYVKATATQTGGSTFLGGIPNTAISLLNGITLGAVCATPTCQTTTSLHTDYSSWQVSGRIASDYHYGIVTLTPSLGLFGGNSKNDQAFTQILTAIGAGSSVYNAATSLAWTDLGGRLGLEGKVAVHPWVTVGLGGWAGWAGRWTDFTGNDNLATNSSSVVASDTKTAFLANLEASVTVKPNPFWAARAFVGVNYDDSVPGFSTPTWTGSAFAPTSAIPAGVVYSKETSYYAGGGVAYKFH